MTDQKLEQAKRTIRVHALNCPNAGGALLDATDTVLVALKEAQKALEQISQGEGRFSRDPFEHACNTIEDMKGIANRALEPKR